VDAPFPDIIFEAGTLVAAPLGAGFDPAPRFAAGLGDDFAADFFVGAGVAAAFLPTGLATGFAVGFAVGFAAGFAVGFAAGFTTGFAAGFPARLLATFVIGFLLCGFATGAFVTFVFACAFAGCFFAGAFAAAFTVFGVADLVGLAAGFLTGLALAFFATTGGFFVGAFLAGDLLDLLTGSASLG
jgi:hypothetical protein